MPPPPPPPPAYAPYNPFQGDNNSPGLHGTDVFSAPSPSSSVAAAHRAPTHQDHQPFSATKRSLQARAKNYNSGSGGPQGREFEERQSRDRALRVLESEELLMWIAASRNESIPQTRSHYRNIVLGLSDLEDADLVWQDEWEVVSTTGGAASPARSAKGKERDVLKGKKRESLAGRMSL